MSEHSLPPGSTKLVSEPLLSAQHRAAWLRALEPAREDQERVRHAIWFVLASGTVSATALAVDGIDLAEEISLVRAALAALNRHQAATALQLLGEHAQRFPHGALEKEAVALQVLARCEQADDPAARAERARFLRAEPASPLSARVRQACAGLP